MKNCLKILLVLVGTILLCVALDLISIFRWGKPIFAIKVKTPYTYVGIFYNIYNCPEYSISQIKAKGVKFSCGINKIDDIIDTTKNIKDFSCAEALERFYEDEENEYYYSCIKSKYVIVKYENGYEETVEAALKNGTIKITDLDFYGINYIAYKKEE